MHGEGVSCRAECPAGLTVSCKGPGKHINGVQTCIRKTATKTGSPDALTWSNPQKCACVVTCPLGEYGAVGYQLKAKGKHKKIFGVKTKIQIKSCPKGLNPTKNQAVCTQSGKWVNAKDPTQENPVLCAYTMFGF